MSFNLDEAEQVDIHDLIMLVEPIPPIQLERIKAALANWRQDRLAASLRYGLLNDDPRTI